MWTSYTVRKKLIWTRVAQNRATFFYPSLFFVSDITNPLDKLEACGSRFKDKKKPSQDDFNFF